MLVPASASLRVTAAIAWPCQRSVMRTVAGALAVSRALIPRVKSVARSGCALAWSLSVSFPAAAVVGAGTLSSAGLQYGSQAPGSVITCSSVQSAVATWTPSASAQASFAPSGEKVGEAWL